jgi:hypothetical protein
MDSFNESERIHTTVLEIRKRVLGEEHLDTLWSMIYLAQVIAAQQPYGEAEILYLELIEIEAKVLGKDHTSTLCDKHNLAHIRSNSI